MKPEDLQCWKCGTSLADILLPFARVAKCKSCNADLHVCCMCRFYDISKSNACSEPLAEKVNDKKRKNFCGYFQPHENAFRNEDSSKASESRNELDNLFGLNADPIGKPVQKDDSLTKLNDLFGLDNDNKTE